MKAKHAALALLIAGVIGAALWYFMQPAEIIPAKVSPAPTPAKTVVPSVVAIEKPALAPVTLPSSPSITVNSDKAPYAPSPHEPPRGVTNLGTIEFTEGVQISIVDNEGKKYFLTANYFPTPGKPSEKMTIDFAPEDPKTGKASKFGETQLMEMGKEVTLPSGSSEATRAEIKLIPVMQNK